MRNSGQSASIRQLLVIAYLVITIPALAFVAMNASAIDHRIKQAQSSEANGSEFALASNPRSAWLNRIGRFIREANAPFSVSPVLDVTSSANRVAALSLSDVRTALIYLWGLIFVLGAVVVWILSVRLNKPLDALTRSVDRLAHGDLVEPVEITGPRNIREMADGLEKLRQRILESDQQQTQFLRHISHEIKTPLTSIKEGSKLLEDELLGPISDEQREVTDILNKSTRELQTSIENLLNYNSSLSVDKVKQRRNVNLAKVLSEAIEKHALTIKKKRIELQTSISHVRAFCDHQQMLTVFDNLISNSIKFSPEKKAVKIWLMREGESIVFRIRDYGPGVKPGQESAIFDAFFVGEQLQKTTLKGTGLGLSIARQYVELHRGTIEVLKTRNGAAFEVTFPG